MIITIVFISVPLLITLAAFIVGRSLSTKAYKGPKSDHFNGKTFINPADKKAKGFPDVFKWMVGRDQGPWMKNYETFVGKKPKFPSKDKIKITFVNHSTFLIQWNKLNILTDPVWSNRCSPFSFAGPQRMRPPGIQFEDLPKIDLVLLSHNHYDHLDIHTVKRIEEKFKPTFVVPLGVSDYLTKKNIQKTIELDWWDETHEHLKITAVPSQHFSGRGFFDRDKSLWCGYILHFDNQKLYFAGDSGYGDFFKEIGKNMGPMDISLIPIGAYLPKWFMSPIHVSPDESIKIHKDVKSKQSIAMHFGTFPLADDGMGRAEKDLQTALSKTKIKKEQFLIPDEGVPLEF
ncbi:MAG: MBL fold metallo-hydrolase [Bacteroidota bacterium]